jgi:integrase
MVSKVVIKTDKQIKALLREGKPARHSCSNGLYFRISEQGSGFWLYKYSINNRRKEMAIGRYPEVSFADANSKILELRKLVSTGKDPKVERDRDSQNPFKTVEDLAQDWLGTKAKKIKHPKIPIRVYKKDIAPLIGKAALIDIKPLDVRHVLEKINGSGRPTIANDALGYMKQLFKHGIKLGLLVSNPAEAFGPEDAGGSESPRTRRLSQDELKEVFKQIDINIETFGYENKLAIYLLLSLGIRKTELIAATWAEFDLDKRIWNLPAERTKTGAAFNIPLTDSVYSVFMELTVFARGSDYVFPNRRASKRFNHISADTLNRALERLFNIPSVKVGKCTVHDLRRTFRTLLSELAVPSHTSERCLNHKIRGVEGVYDRYDYFQERKVALHKISEKLELLLERPPITRLRELPFKEF